MEPEHFYGVHKRPPLNGILTYVNPVNTLITIVLIEPLLGWQSNLIRASALRDWKVAMDALTEVGGTPLEHPPYSPDLAPCDFWAFPTTKRELRDKKFRNDQRSAARFREVGGAL
jgi:hypothetical protein